MSNFDIYGEREIIKDITELMHKENITNNLLGNNDDAVAIQIGNDEVQIINIDGWVESTDRVPGMSYFDCGYRAVVNAASDVLVKGAKPSFMLISLSIPETKKGEIRDIVSGFISAANDNGINYLGGDMNASNDVVIDVTVFGFATKNKLIKRNTISLDEFVCWLGPHLGSTAAAFGILLNKWDGDEKIALKIVGHPVLYHEFLSIQAKSAIDCSDGLAISLYQLIEESSIGIDINFDITNHTCDWVKKIAKLNSKKIDDMVFYGGEELGIIFSTPSIDNLPDNVIVLGKTTSKHNEVYFNNKKLEKKGWEHFT